MDDRHDGLPEKVEAASQGQIAPKRFDSGQPFADSDVIKVMELGQWKWQHRHLACIGLRAGSRHKPATVVLRSPVELTHRAVDGMPGDLVNQEITRKLRLTVPGRWIDLGFTIRTARTGRSRRRRS